MASSEEYCCNTPETRCGAHRTDQKQSLAADSINNRHGEHREYQVRGADRHRLAYAARDLAAEEVIRETLDLLAYWLGNIIDLLEPEVIVIGGGVSTMLAPFLNEIRERWRGACLNPAPMEIPLVLARYGEDAGIAGAAALCEFE